MTHSTLFNKHFLVIVLCFCAVSICFANTSKNNIAEVFKSHHDAKHQSSNSQDWLASDSPLHISGGIDPLTGKNRDMLAHSQSTVDQLQNKYRIEDMWLKFKVDLE